MFKNFMSLKVRERGLIGIGICILFFILGYAILNHISTKEDSTFENTFFIFLGSTITILSILGVFLILNYLYDYKKKKEKRELKRKKHKLSFLKKSNTKESDT